MSKERRKHSSSFKAVALEAAKGEETGPNWLPDMRSTPVKSRHGRRLRRCSPTHSVPDQVGLYRRPD